MLQARRIERLSFVSVDTEGWDGFVLRGMRGALERKVVDVFEFEYMRAWKQHLGATGLADTLRWLDGVGYTCFWQGNRGALAQASGGCWVDEFQTRMYGDPTDVFQHTQDQRVWAVNPITSIPNDQGSFANWLYRVPGRTCKEGNNAACFSGTEGGVVTWLSAP